jgi:3-methyladenine DNA glycosylase AlkD
MEADVNEVVDLLKEKANPANAEGMKRFGINTSTALGVSIPELRKLAKLIKKDQQLSLKLWETGIHEAQILASMIGDPKQVTEEQMDSWTADFSSWDVCDQTCGNLFDKTPFVSKKIEVYTASQQEFVKRAGFVLIAYLAVHDKKAPDQIFTPYFSIIEREAWDNRNFVKKAVNWALRQIGKRNAALNSAAIETAIRIIEQNTPAARWIGRDALAELEAVSLG